MIIVEFLVGLIAGILSGFGIGGGTILILWLTLVSGMDQLHAGGMNLLFFPAPAAPALISHHKNKLIDGKTVLFCIVAGIPSCIAASIFASKIDVSLLRRGFGILLLYVGVRELLNRNKQSPKTPKPQKDN